jgi:hypothetical protein
MHINWDGGWFGSLFDGTPLCDSERRQAEGVFSFVSGWPLTDVITAVQPEGGRGQKLNPPDTLNLAPHSSSGIIEHVHLPIGQKKSCHIIELEDAVEN